MLSIILESLTAFISNHHLHTICVQTYVGEAGMCISRSKQRQQSPRSTESENLSLRTRLLAPKPERLRSLIRSIALSHITPDTWHARTSIAILLCCHLIIPSPWKRDICYHFRRMLWVATSQCLGGSASCVNIAERLNDRLRQCKSSESCLSTAPHSASP